MSRAEILHLYSSEFFRSIDGIPVRQLGDDHLVWFAEAVIAKALERQGSGWINVEEKLPEYGVMVLVTDGSHLAGGSRSFDVEGETKLRGYEADGTISDRFTERIPNPDAGKRHEYFFPYGCSAFDKDTEVHDYDGSIYFEPTHWMPLPSPPQAQDAQTGEKK